MTTEATLDAIKKALATEAIAKANNTVTTATGLAPYDLQAPAKNLYPVNTPIRNRLPRVPGIGTATNWKTITGLVGSGYNAMGSVPEGQRTAAMTMTTGTGTASFVTIGEEAQATFEAINAGVGFDDIQARDTLVALQKLMLKEENHLLGGNVGVALGTPTAPTLAAAGTGANLPALTYSVIVVALSYMGRMNSSLTSGVATTQVFTGQDNSTYTLKGGSSNKSAAATQAVALGQTLSCSVTAIRGAVAYAWYVGAVGSERLEAITTINSAIFNTPLLGTLQLATAIVADNSTNSGALDFNGLLYTAFTAASGAYVASLPTGTPGTGTVLTASGRGSIVEIDTMFQGMWDANQISPTVLYMNSQELRNATNKILTGGAGAPLVRFNMDAMGQTPRAVAGAVIGSYFNPFATNADSSGSSGFEIPIRLHPTLPAGTILAMCENLPVQYQTSNVPNVAEVKVRKDYYQLDWPIVTRARQFGVYSEEVLAVYAPFGLGVITNIANG